MGSDKITLDSFAVKIFYFFFVVGKVYMNRERQFFGVEFIVSILIEQICPLDAWRDV